MSSFVTDSLQKQILRQELWTGSTYEAPITNQNINVLISVGAKECIFSADIVLNGKAAIWLYEGTTTSADGTPITNYNMYRSSAATLLTTTFSDPTVTAVGTIISKTVSSTDGRVTQATAFNSENGMALQANTKYYLYILDEEPSVLDCSISWFLREL